MSINDKPIPGPGRAIELDPSLPDMEDFRFFWEKPTSVVKLPDADFNFDFEPASVEDPGDLTLEDINEAREAWDLHKQGQATNVPGSDYKQGAGVARQEMPTDPGFNLTANNYQEQTRTLDIYPRVYTEEQVREMIWFAVGDYLMNAEEEQVAMNKWIDEILYDWETPWNRLVLHALGLASEAGEIASKVKKIGRDQGGLMNPEQVDDMGKELGDVQWYLANLASDLQVRLGKLMRINLDKLFSRKARGVIGGSGDNR